MAEYREHYRDISMLDLVATDRDLVGYHEVQIQGDTKDPQISLSREDALFDYDHEQLVNELMRDYKVTRDEVFEAEQICIRQINERLRYLNGQA